jgi:hypothetical protein
VQGPLAVELEQKIQFALLSTGAARQLLHILVVLLSLGEGMQLPGCCPGSFIKVVPLRGWDLQNMLIQNMVLALFCILLSRLNIILHIVAYHLVC